MIHLADFTTKAPDHEKSASPILRQLFGAPVLAQLEGGERQRLEGARWLVRTVDKGCALIDQGEFSQTDARTSIPFYEPMSATREPSTEYFLLLGLYYAELPFIHAQPIRPLRPTKLPWLNG